MSPTEQEVLEGTEQAGQDETEGRAAEQKRIDAEFDAAARDRARVQQEAARLLDKATQRFEEATKQMQPVQEDKAPARDEFDSYESFLEAKIEYQKREFHGYVDRQVEAAVRMHRQSAQETAEESRMRESAERGEELYPGFEDLIAQIPAMPKAALQAFQELPEPEHVAQYFGTHKDEAKKLSKMTPGRAAHAVIELDKRLDEERKAKNGAKDEPREFGPKAGGKATPGGISANMSMDQYAQARIQEKLRAMKG